MVLSAREYWNTIGVKKNFEDPLYLEKIAHYLHKSSRIVEYGCGYGRLLHFLKAKGYENLVGYDYAPAMIERGRTAYPGLELHAIQESGKVSMPDSSADLVVMSTILCCIIEKEEQKRIISEMRRILKKGGILYLSDFSICAHPRYKDKYADAERIFGEWGIYTTAEGLTVRHHSTEWIADLLREFDILWMEQFDFKTMNQNPARTIHCVSMKK
jgi:SAM-dependent methyltransferase